MRIFGISKRKMTYATIILKYPHVSLLTVKFFVAQFVTDFFKNKKGNGAMSCKSH